MAVSKKDKELLRGLASQVAELAALPDQAKTIDQWKALNGLKPIRPMVMIDEIPWHEMGVDEELTLQTEDAFCRSIEAKLRRTLYSWRHMRADMVIEPVIEIPKVIRGMGFGIEIVEKKSAIDPLNDVVSHYYFDQLNTEEDIQKIRDPEVVLDEEATVEAEEKAHELFDGIIAVRMQGYTEMKFAPWDLIIRWRGVENPLFDLVDRPEFIHSIVSRLTDAHISLLDQLEEQALLGFGQSMVHCSGAYTDELPAPSFAPECPRARDLWTYGMAQIFSDVSPAMHQEFELEYANRWYSRFGLVYYGCCEPLHGKIDIIRNIPNVRKISMSPTADVEKGAERIGADFVFSRKPSPAFLAEDTWRPDVVEQDLSDTLDWCTRCGSPVELILKDISTVRYQPQRLWEWADIAMRLVGG